VSTCTDVTTLLNAPGQAIDVSPDRLSWHECGGEILIDGVITD
jgi:hypothetical protein